MKKILFWLDYNVISHIANWCGQRDQFIKYMYKMYPEHFTNEVQYKEDKKKDEKALKCPGCGGSSWYEGPSGGCSVNIECADCGNRYNYTFGLTDLQPIGKREQN